MVEIVRGARFRAARRETWEEDLKALMEEGVEPRERSESSYRESRVLEQYDRSWLLRFKMRTAEDQNLG